MATQEDEPFEEQKEDTSVDDGFWGRLLPIITGNGSSVSTAACLDLTVEEHTVGRMRSPARPWLVIDNPRISSQHAKFVCKNGEPVLVDSSTNGTWVNGVQLIKGNEHVLNNGDTISFVKPDQSAASDPPTSGNHHLFTFIAGRTMEVGGTSLTAASSASDAPGGSSDEAMLVTCSICQEILHRAVALQPCLHNFCGGCASKWLRRKSECPECRKPSGSSPTPLLSAGALHWP